MQSDYNIASGVIFYKDNSIIITETYTIVFDGVDTSTNPYII